MPGVRPLRLPLPFYADLAVRYIAPYGDDDNDGYDLRYPMKTLIAAYDSLPDSGGTIYVVDGSYIGGELSKQGFLITAVGPLYPGWRALKTLKVIGYTGSATSAQFGTPAARLHPGNPDDVGFYFPPDSQFSLWVTGNGSAGGSPITFQNIICDELRGSLRLGGDPNPAVDPYGPDSMTIDFTTALFWADNCSFTYAGDGNPATAQPGIHVGYVIWVYFSNCTINRPTDADPTSDRRAAILVKPVGGSSQVRISQCRGSNGGLVQYWGNTAGGVDIDGYLVEGTFGDALPPVVWVKGTNKFGQGRINNVSVADAGEGSSNPIVLDGSHTAGQFFVTGVTGPPEGTCTFFACSESNVGNPEGTVTPALHNQIATAGGRLWGDMDFVRQQTPVISNRVYNLCPQHDSRNGETGPVTNPTIIENSANRVWTQAGATAGVGSHTVVDSPIVGKSGGNTGIQLASNDGSPAYQRLFYAYRVVQVGDIIVCGAWMRFPNNPADSGAPLGMALTNGDLVWEDHSGELFPAFYGDGQWSYLKGYGKILSLGTQTEALVNFLAPNIDQDHPVVIDQRFIAHIPAGTMSDNEFAQFFQNLASYTQNPIGSAVTQPTQLLIANGGLGTGDLEEPVAVDSVEALQPWYDANGDLVGYIRVWSLDS